MRGLISYIKELVTGKKGDPDSNPELISKFVHEMEKSLVSINTACKRYQKSSIDKQKFINILDEDVSLMRQQFTNETRDAFMKLKDRTGELFIEKITRLQALSYQLKEYNSDHFKFNQISEELKAFVNEADQPLLEYSRVQIEEQLGKFYGFDDVVYGAVHTVERERDQDLKKFSINIKKRIAKLEFDKVLDESDFVKWRTVILNLVRNAIDAVIPVVDSATEVSDDRKKIMVRLDILNKAVTIEISDRGCGMDDETLKQIFTARFSTKAKTGISRGIGLNTEMREFIEQTGMISCSSKESAGTTFFIRYDM